MRVIGPLAHWLDMDLIPMIVKSWSFFIIAIQPFQPLRPFDEIVDLSRRPWHSQISIGYALLVWKVW